MCTVSMVYDWGIKKYPLPPIDKGLERYPSPYMGPTREEWQELKDLIKKAMEIDEKTGQPDCVDLKKKEWLEQMEKLYDNLKGI